MASSLLVPASVNEPGGRISQLLPTVKCSSCAEPVALTELGDHVCKPRAQGSIPPLSARTPSPGAVPFPSATSPVQRGHASPGLPPPPVRHSQSPNYPRSASTPPRQPPATVIPPPQRYGTPAPDRPRLNTSIPQPSSYQPKSSPLARRGAGEEDSLRPRDPFASNIPPPRPIPAADPRVRSISNAPQPPPPNPSRGPPGALPPHTGVPDARVRALSSASQMNYPTPSISQRPPPNSPLAPNPPGDGRRPSFNSTRDMQQPPMPASRMGGPPSPMMPPRSPMSPHPGSPMPAGVPPPFLGTPMSISVQLPPGTPVPVIKDADLDTKSGGEAGMAGVGRRGFAAAARAAMFATNHNLYSPQLQGSRDQHPRPLNLDAASRSTETPPLSAGSGHSSHSPGFASPFPQSPVSPGPVPTPTQTTPSASPDGADIKSHNEVFKRPPPLTIFDPNATSFGNGPATPLSARMPFFERFKNKPPNIDTTGSNAYSPTTNSPRNAATAQDEKPSDTVVSPADSSSSYYSRRSGRSSPSRMSRRKFSINHNTMINGNESNLEPPMSPSSGSEYGLAYADTDEEEDDKPDEDNRLGKLTTPVPNRSRSILRNGAKTSKDNGLGENSHVRFPSGSATGSGKDRKGSFGSESTTSRSSLDRQHAEGGRRGRSGSTASSKSAYSRVASVHVGGLSALDKAMETLQEERSVPLPSPWGDEPAQSSSVVNGISTSPISTLDSPVIAFANALGVPGGSTSKRSNTVQGSAETRASVKLPMRSKTSPSIGDSSRDAVDPRKERRSKKPKACLKCEVTIEVGKWVQVDGGGALCEKCWKNMYLPKCRRCNLPIERQAVSSSDGQLKGKYHRECFNCHTCHKPFPDKSFYVFDGKPFCAYHYHEANDSLCAAAMCGQPIEGPCAVSHTGDKYHPEHMTCEYAGYPKCDERLEEYWEVDGRMMCERHANMSLQNGGDEEDEDDDDHYGLGYDFGNDSDSRKSRVDVDEWRQRRATKRVTRFIDLTTGLGGSDLR